MNTANTDDRDFSPTINTVTVIVAVVLAIGLISSVIYLIANKSNSTAHAGSYQLLGSGSINATSGKVNVSLYGCTKTVDGQTFLEVLSELSPNVNATQSGVFGGYDINYLTKTSQGQTTTNYLPGYVASDESWTSGYSQSWQSENLNLIPTANRPSTDVSVAIYGQNDTTFKKLGIPIDDITSSCD